MTGAGEILASNCKKPLLHNVWNPKVSWWQANLLSEANTLVMLLGSSSLWLAKLQMELAPKQLD